MEGQPEVAAERFAEMLDLELAFPDERTEVRQWIGECVGAIYLLLQTESAIEERIRTLGGFGKAMWQKGYEAIDRPQLER